MSLASQLAGDPFPREDFIVLGGERSPGLCKVRGGGSPRTWDIQQGYGLSGATIVFTGAGLSKFEVDIFAWLPEHFPAFDRFAAKVLALPAPVRNAKSLAITHPLLNTPPVSIFQCVVEDVTQWEESDETGLWMRTIKCIHFRAPKPLLVKPQEGPPGSPVAVVPDPEVAQIRANNAAIAALGAQLAGS